MGNVQQVKLSLQETRAQLTEQRDKESQRNNVVLYKVPESVALRAEDRNKVDMAFCLQLFNNGLQVGAAEEDMVNAFRLGKRDADSDTPRKIMIQLASY